MRKKYDISIDSKNRSVFENFHIASILLVIYDIIMSAGAYLAALWIRFDCQYSQIPQDYFMAWLKFMPIYAVVCVFVFWLFKLYQSVWKYASFSELARTAVASLVLQAGTYAKGGEIFVLDMGSPVKIDTLARNLIKLSGLRPDVDIEIEYTGLRPGEKLYEEKLMSEEGMRTTPNKLIHIGSPIPFDADTFLGQLQMLMEAAYAGKENEIRTLAEGVVTTYHPAGKHGSEYKGETFEEQMELVGNKEHGKEKSLAAV